MLGRLPVVHLCTGVSFAGISWKLYRNVRVGTLSSTRFTSSMQNNLSHNNKARDIKFEIVRFYFLNPSHRHKVNEKMSSQSETTSPICLCDHSIRENVVFFFCLSYVGLTGA